MPKSESATYKFGNAQFNYTIVRSARRKKTIEITLDPQSGVVVRSPSRIPSAEIAAFVHKRAAWIIRNATNDILRPKQRRFTDGETLFYLGKELPIITEASHNQTVSVRLEQDAFRIAAPAPIAEDQRAAAAKEAIERWYRKESARLLPDIVHSWESKVGVKKSPRVLIRNQRKRWGSCSSDGTIRLNLRLIMAEAPLIDYVVVHELAHLIQMNHSPRYWKHVERVMPDYRSRRQRLNELGMRFWF